MEKTNPIKKDYTILVVDDDELTRTIYQDRFEKEDLLKVVVASDGLEGWEKVQTIKPDLVFTGIFMPRMDGFQLIEKMKKYDEFKSIPIIISSHYGRAEDKERAESLGIEHFMVRGVTSPNQVVNSIFSILSLKNATFVVRLDPEAFEYKKFVSTQFDQAVCSACLRSELLPIELKVVETYPRKLYEIKVRCDLCESKK